MRTELFWIDSPWPGRLAIMPRPRGGDWLEEEIQSWRRTGIDVVVSLLTPDETTDLDLSAEKALCKANGIEFVGYPIEDRSVPSSMDSFSKLIANLAGQLASGTDIAIHCRQGIGRAALVAICLLVFSGVEPALATERAGTARGCAVPETSEQRRWIADFARSLMTGLPK